MNGWDYCHAFQAFEIALFFFASKELNEVKAIAKGGRQEVRG